MRRIAIVAALAMSLSGPLPAAADGTAIQGVISSQIEAFRADDLATAFAFASPAIRNIFRTPENFGRMVREGYPMVWRPAELRFGALEERGGRLYQRVTIEDGAGALHALEYEMIETDAGWQINGVQFLRLPDPGV